MRGVVVVVMLAGCGDNLSGDEVPDANAPEVPHDEDRDGIADRLDNCPHIANADQSEVLEILAGVTVDGVGDACDPQPDRAGNSIVVFQSLHDARMIRASVPGGIQVEDDALRVDQWAIFDPLPARVVLTAQVRFDATAERANAVMTRLATTPTGERMFGICARDYGGPGRLELFTMDDSIDAAAPRIAPGQPYSLSLSTADTWTCSSTAGGVVTTVSAPGPGFEPPATHPHFAPGARMWIDYLVAITLAP